MRIARAISFKEALRLSLRAEVRAVLVRDVSGLNTVVAPEAALGTARLALEKLDSLPAL